MVVGVVVAVVVGVVVFNVVLELPYKHRKVSHQALAKQHQVALNFEPCSRGMNCFSAAYKTNHLLS
jgi:hypothetical protein